MHPILVDFPGFYVSSYAVFLALASVVSIVVMVNAAERLKVRFTYLTATGILLGALLGGRAFWILQYGSWTGLWRAFQLWAPGTVLYGGVLGGLLVIGVVSRVQRIPVLDILDVVAPHVALAEGIARIGCFLAGCCWGTVCTVPWGVRYPAGSYPYDAQLDAGLLDALAQRSLPAHPTQIYMTIGLALSYAVLRRMLFRPHPRGLVVASYFACYGCLRFVVECFRGDSARPIMGMTISQFISVTLVVLGACGVIVLKRTSCRGKELSDA